LGEKYERKKKEKNVTEKGGRTKYKEEIEDKSVK
jgi:hypothetical protein